MVSKGEAFSAKSRFVANFIDTKMLRPYKSKTKIESWATKTNIPPNDFPLTKSQ
jgi:hypothetical protein